MNILSFMQVILFLSTVLILLSSCTPPNLVQLTDEMYAHEAFQRHGIPQLYILKVTDRGDSANYLDDAEIKINDAYWQPMILRSGYYHDGIPQVHEYNMGDLIETIESVTYQYRFNYQGRTLFGIGNKEVYYPSKNTTIFLEKPNWLRWKEEDSIEWNETSEYTHSVLIEDEGCFTEDDVNQTLLLENPFLIKNVSSHTVYINHPMTSIIDLNNDTPITNPDRFNIELIDPYSNELIELSPEDEVNFKLQYSVTIAGPGNIGNDVRIVFHIGDTAGQYTKRFMVGASMRFEQNSSCP